MRVNAIAPGIIATPLTKPIRDNPEWSRVYAARAAIQRRAEPSELAGPIVLLASEAGSYMTGTTVLIDGGWCAIDGRHDPPV